MEAATALPEPSIIDEVDQDEQDFLAELRGDYEPIERTSDMDMRLEYLLEKLEAVELQIASNNDVARRRIDMIRAWEHGQNETLQKQVGWLTFEIGQTAPPDRFAFKLRYGKLSRELPHGKVGFRAKPDSVEITDPAAAVAYAEANGLDLNTKTTVKVVTNVRLKT